MPDDASSQEPIHRFTSLGRPLDPSWPSNLAVLLLMPLAALAVGFFGSGTPGLGGTPRAWAAALGAGVVLGAWALGRELAPDDQRAAFVAMAFALAALLAVPGTSLLLLFTTLVMVRLVNRSVGLPARSLDGLALLLLTGWSMVATGSPGVGLVGTAAFVVDAALPGGLRRQWWFAAMSLALVGVLTGMGLASFEPSLVVTMPFLFAAIGVGAVFADVLIRTRGVRATGDATDAPLSVRRVQWGMAIALAMAAQGLALGGSRPGTTALLWTCIAGVAVSGVAPPGTKPDGA
ncbi:MAG: hypothetical protein WD995_09880, partial [Gemmatimonadota bacterium]